MTDQALGFNQTQLHFFKTFGYTVLRKLLTPDELEIIGREHRDGLAAALTLHLSPAAFRGSHKIISRKNWRKPDNGIRLQLFSYFTNRQPDAPAVSAVCPLWRSYTLCISSIVSK